MIEACATGLVHLIPEADTVTAAREEILAELRTQLAQLQPTPVGILAAVSGGADSVALLRALVELQHESGYRLHAAHYNHRTRAADSHTDQQFVTSLCEQLQIPFHIGQRDDAVSFFETERRSEPNSPDNEASEWFSEQQLRQLRYDFLLETAQQNQLAFVATGHHAEDQLETMLHHLLRGTHLRGLTGIPARRPLSADVHLFRPLLRIAPETLLDYLATANQPYRNDCSNSDLSFTRNKIRHQLIPLINSIQPGAPANLLRLQDQIRDIHTFHQKLVGQLYDRCMIECCSDIVRLKLPELQQADPVIIRELCVTIWLQQAWPRQKMTAAHWQRICEFLSDSARALQLPAGITVRKRAQMLVIERTAGQSAC